MSRFLALLLVSAWIPASGAAPVPATFFQPKFLDTSGSVAAAADFNGDGNLDLAIAGADLTIALGNGRGQFRLLAPIAYGASQIAAGDFNGDGHPDLVLAVGNQLLLLPGNGDGTFGSPSVIASSKVTEIVPIDLNRDGKLDLLIDSTSVIALLGNGNGTFQPPLPTVAGNNYFVVADFNRDGIPDFAATTINTSGDVLQMYPGKGDGTFGSAVNTSLSGATGLLTAGDFNGDGQPDVLIATTSGMQVYFGQGTGAFTPGPATAVFVNSVVAGDLNGDGKLDLVSNAMGVLLGNGDGTFQTPVYYQGGGGELILGQFRNQGPLDVVAGGLYYRNRGNGKLEDPQVFVGPYSGGCSDSCMVAGDFNGDGKPDVVVAGGDTVSNLSIAFFPGNGHGALGASVETSIGTFPAYNDVTDLIAEDFNHDGKLDIAASISTNVIAVLLGNGDGTFQPPILTSTNGSRMAAGDFNHDGKLDLAVLNSTSPAISVFLGNGDGTFFLKSTLTGVEDSAQLIAVDLNGDGKLDLATPGDIFLGNGDGTFTHAPPLGFPGNVVVTADFNRDGIPDLATYSTGTATLSVWLGKGDGTFAPPLSFRVDVYPPAMVAADFNLDGKPDIYLTDGIAGPEVLLGNGDGTFSLELSHVAVGPLEATTQPLIVADFNVDGRPDVGLYTGALMTILNTTRKGGVQ